MTEKPTVRRPNYIEEVGELFGSVPTHRFLGMQLSRIEPGYSEVLLPFRKELTQQTGTIHAGILLALADTAAGCAGWSLIKPDQNLLSVNIHVSLMRPALAETLPAEGRVLKTGKRQQFTEAIIYADGDAEKSLFIKASITMAVVEP
ncbi:MAG: PaaI family thioesterase [candidate division Zixibacteria bacterium]